MEDLLHETIHKIKNLKIEGILNESGMPTDQHADALKEDIEECIATFETTTNELLVTVDDGGEPDGGFVFANIAKLEAFVDDGTESCLDAVELAFYSIYDTRLGTTADSGEKYNI